MDDENATAIESNIVDQVTPSKVKKERAKKTPFVVKQGLGIYLFEIPHFYLELQARESSSVACKALHSLLFGTSGRKNEIKRNLLLFSGFPAEVSTKEKKLKVLRNKEVWTTTIIEEVLGMLGLETHGDKFDIVDRLIDFLAEPIVGTKTRRRRKRDTKSDKKQIKRLKKAESIKKSHSAYILYCMDQRATLAEELMLLPFKEQGVLLGTKWKALDEEAKKFWVEKAAQARQAALPGANADDTDVGNSDNDGYVTEGASEVMREGVSYDVQGVGGGDTEDGMDFGNSDLDGSDDDGSGDDKDIESSDKDGCGGEGAGDITPARIDNSRHDDEASEGADAGVEGGDTADSSASDYDTDSDSVPCT